MTRSHIVLGVLVLAVVSSGLWQSSLIGQEFETPVIVCAPCAGEAFGFSGEGIVLMKANGGGGDLWFYPLDRAAAEPMRRGFGQEQTYQSLPRRVGRIGSAGSPLVWAPQE